MNRFFFIVAVTLGMLTACERAEITEENGGNFDASATRKFTFIVKGDFKNPEFITRANDYMVADGVEMTDLWVVDYKDGEIKQMLHQTKGDDNWGSPAMALTLGTHHVMFLTSRGQNPTYTDGIVTWSKPLDTFYKDYEVTVVKTSNGNRAVTLNRVATKMSLVIEDVIAQGTTTISLSPTKWYTGFNMLTGESVEGTDYEMVFSTVQPGAKNVTLLMWGMSPADEWRTDIAVTSKADDAVNASAVIEGAPFLPNRTTRYTGSLYSHMSQSSVSLLTQWLQAYEGVY